MTDELHARAALPVGPQVRSYPARFEVRGLAGSRVEVSGYASTTEQPYKMYDAFGDYDEVVRRGAFAKTIAEGADVAFLTNHGGLTLARTKSGSLMLSEDDHGLHSVATLNTNRGDARDLLTAIEDGDVDEMSFAFRVVRQTWSPDFDQRDLVELNLNRGDVSAVNYGANPTTNIGLRSFRTKRAADLARVAGELRAGKTLSAATLDVLAQVLDLLATADRAVDDAQPLLADLMGVPNPDTDGEAGEPAADAEGERAAAMLAMLARHERAERARRSA